MTLRALCLLAVIVPVAASGADDPCTAFAWDVHTELALLVGNAVRLRSGTDDSTAPLIGKAAAYRLALAHQAAVHFAADPGKYSDADGRFAGLVKLHIPRPGRYRVSLDAAAWVDVVAEGHVVPAAAYTGSHDCARLRKVLEFQLPAGPATIQVSDSQADHLRLAVTASQYRPAT